VEERCLVEEVLLLLLGCLCGIEFFLVRREFGHVYGGII
jgi:hypothetical protein